MNQTSDFFPTGHCRRILHTHTHTFTQHFNEVFVVRSASSWLHCVIVGNLFGFYFVALLISHRWNGIRWKSKTWNTCKQIFHRYYSYYIFYYYFALDGWIARFMNYFEFLCECSDARFTFLPIHMKWQRARSEIDAHYARITTLQKNAWFYKLHKLTNWQT